MVADTKAAQSMSQTQPLPPKKDVALALLERSSVYVHLDPRQPAVIVPVAFKKKAQLVLQIGLNMPVPIPDLRLDDDGIRCTLSFNSVPFFCVVPWGSVFAMMGDDGRGMVWPDDVPLEVARQAQVRVVDGGAENRDSTKSAAQRDPQHDLKSDAPVKAKRARKRPALAAVSDGAEAGEKRVAAKAVKGALAGAERPVRAGQPNAARAGDIPGAMSQSQAGQTGGGARKKKRELPPYLRVVK
jgi:stringent starvation protein B